MHVTTVDVNVCRTGWSQTVVLIDLGAPLFTCLHPSELVFESLQHTGLQAAVDTEAMWESFASALEETIREDNKLLPKKDLTQSTDQLIDEKLVIC